MAGSSIKAELVIVIDVGCAKYGGDESIPYLIEEFDPDVVYGFDPSPAIGAVQPIEGDRPLLYLIQKAAWTHDGMVGFEVAGTSGHVDHVAKQVPCVDLAQFILDLPENDEIVLKLDCEGAEFDLLPWLFTHDADLRLKLAWVERHCRSCGRGGGGHRDGCKDTKSAALYDQLAAAKRCEMHEWNR